MKEGWRDEEIKEERKNVGIKGKAEMKEVQGRRQC